MFISVVLGVEPRALCMLAKHCPQSRCFLVVAMVVVVVWAGKVAQQVRVLVFLQSTQVCFHITTPVTLALV